MAVVANGAPAASYLGNGVYWTWNGKLAAGPGFLETTTVTSDEATGDTTTIRVERIARTAVDHDLIGHGITWDNGGAATVQGTASLSLGGLSLTATGTRTTAGTASLPLGGLTLSATGVRTVSGTAALSLGGLALTAAGTRTAPGVATLALGALTLAATGVRTVPGVALLALGGLTLTASGGAPATDLADLLYLTITEPKHTLTVAEPTHTLAVTEPTHSLEVDEVPWHSGDRIPRLVLTISDAAGTVDLTGHTVEVHIARPAGGAVITGAATLLNQVTNRGQCYRDWGDGDLSLPGRYRVEAQLDTGANVQTVGPVEFTVASQIG